MKETVHYVPCFLCACAVGFRLNILQVSIMSCHIPVRRMKDELAFGKPESTHWSLACVISLSLGQRRGGWCDWVGSLLWLLGECVGGLQTVTSTVAVFSLNCKRLVLSGETAAQHSLDVTM